MPGVVGIALRGFGKALGKLGKKKINRGEGDLLEGDDIEVLETPRGTEGEAVRRT